MDHPGADGAHRIGPYALLGKESTAGGSEVFAARTDEGLLVTVTVVGPEIAAAPGFRDRFRAAVERARTLSGAFLVPVVDADADAPVPWLATRFTAGLPLRQAVDRHGPLSEPALRVLADGLARALATLHAAGTVHGEVSPDSVLLTMDGPRITALGMAGATGSPAPSPTDDMFDLGATVLFAASGGEPDTDALPVSLREVIGGCRYPEPPERPTAEQLVAYLKHQNLPSLAGSWLPPAVTADMAAATAAVGSVSSGSDGRGPLPPPPQTAAGTGVSRRKLIIGLAGGVAVLGGAAAALAFSGDSSPAPDGRAGGPGPTARPASPSGGRSTSAHSASPSSTDGPEPVVLAGPDAVKAWSEAGKHAPTCLEASDKVVMVVTDTATSFLDAATGKSKFHQLKATNEFRMSGFKYPTAYADGVFYLLCDTPSYSGVLAAFDAASGKAKWATGLAASDPGGAKLVSMYPSNYVAVAGNTVYVCGQVRQIGGKYSAESPTTGYIRAFNAATGKKLWQVKGTDINNVLVPPSGSHLLATSAVPGKKPGRVQMIDAGRKGARGWKVSVPHASYYFTLGWPLTCYAAGLFLFAGGNGNTLFAVDAATGTEKWHQRFDSKNGDQVKIGTPFAGPDGATVYVPVGSDLAALSTADGKLRWVAVLDGASDTGGSNLFNASLTLGGKNAQCSADTVFATDSAKTLWAIDAATGRARWRYSDPGQPDVGFMWTVGGDHVFIASHLTMTAIAVHGR
ncbi:PQQ-binding-like beta-propeller repeat protein [Streptomyces sp. NBC_00893]|uniref:outer membrane protein assembly factor BamB family protein n=1 Tax=Streptomyces sp. NBC_00893 TaxID=2975862 RepID=UPI002258720E|nr:PQQ-binding-like beta-propeller repeat protein [Streptomyces sp. NBC_00893]MCX4847314.1 PQQ-binding-like beta-propeller repeat protein [Streptomyces sp. NBC_00893]